MDTFSYVCLSAGAADSRLLGRTLIGLLGGNSGGAGKPFVSHYLRNQDIKVKKCIGLAGRMGI